MNEFERCLKERRIVAIKATREMIEKELKGAEYDLFIMEMRNMAHDFKFKKIQNRLKIYIYGVNGGTPVDV